MRIDIENPQVEARIQRQIKQMGAANAEEALTRLLETQEEQDRWLIDNFAESEAKIQRGLEQSERGELIHEDELDAFLIKMKAQVE